MLSKSQLSTAAITFCPFRTSRLHLSTFVACWRKEPGLSERDKVSDAQLTSCQSLVSATCLAMKSRFLLPAWRPGRAAGRRAPQRRLSRPCSYSCAEAWSADVWTRARGGGSRASACGRRAEEVWSSLRELTTWVGGLTARKTSNDVLSKTEKLHRGHEQSHKPSVRRMPRRLSELSDGSFERIYSHRDPQNRGQWRAGW